MAREAKKAGGGFRWRLWLSVALVAGLGATSAAAALKVRRYALTDPQFTLSRDRKDAISFEGLVYSSRAKAERVFASDFGKSVFSVPLAERRRRLLAIDWVEEASVSRIWPDRLVVRVRERKPVAFVSFRAGVLLIDRQGVLLDPPPKARFAFPVLSGVREDESDTARRERVRTLLRVEEDLGGLMKDISEVNAAEAEDVRLVVQAGNRAVELLVGDGNFGARYSNFLAHYAEIQKRSPGVKTFDLRLDDRITAKE
jgi:cell division protein FtsQ